MITHVTLQMTKLEVPMCGQCCSLDRVGSDGYCQDCSVMNTIRYPECLACGSDYLVDNGVCIDCKVFVAVDCPCCHVKAGTVCDGQRPGTGHSSHPERWGRFLFDNALRVREAK